VIVSGGRNHRENDHGQEAESKAQGQEGDPEGCSLAQEESQSGVAPKAGGEKGEGKKESS
jgi:hypothetical protein